MPGAVLDRKLTIPHRAMALCATRRDMSTLWVGTSWKMTKTLAEGAHLERP